MQMTQGGNFRHLHPFSRSGEGVKVTGVISLLVVIFKPIYFRLATVPENAEKNINEPTLLGNITCNKHKKEMNVYSMFSPENNAHQEQRFSTGFIADTANSAFRGTIFMSQFSLGQLPKPAVFTDNQRTFSF